MTMLDSVFIFVFYHHYVIREKQFKGGNISFGSQLQKF